MTNRIFNATLESVSTNKSKTFIKLSLSNKEAKLFSSRYLDSIDKELRVSFDDPQMEMDIQPAVGGRPGLVATVNERGEVENVRQQEIGDDDNEDRLFDQADPEQEESEVGEENADESEVEFDDDEHSEESDPVDESEEEGEPIDPEAIEEFILSEKPLFDDIPYNFPELLRQRRDSDVTWMDLAREAGIPSTRLQTSYQDYKKLVVKRMREQGVA